MAEKWKGTIAPGDDHEISDMASLALVGVRFRGNVRIEMDEDQSGDPVPVVDGAQNYGTYAGYQLGSMLRLVNVGTTDATVTVDQ